MRNEIKVNRTAHYYTINEEHNVKEVLFAIHGYAQLASEFIEEFRFLENTSILVVAPEGLSRFYGRDRTPVSSWMTSHERESEIADYINYLNQLLHELKVKYSFEKINILGFSQGSSTALRWLNQLNEESIDVHICSGSIPPEIEPSDSFNKLVSQAYFYYGDNDRLMNPSQANAAIEKLKELELNLQVVQFKGIHEISSEVKKILSANLG